MRKFLNDYDSIVTLEELKNGEEYSQFKMDYPGATFEQYLAECMYWNNGFLTEILTRDTPKSERRKAVSLCALYDCETGEFACVEWLDYYGIVREKGKLYGYIVTPYLGGW